MHRSLLLALCLLAAPVAAQSGVVHELREVELPPRALNPEALLAALEAGYPAGAVDSAFGGTVRVSLVVDSSGAPREVRVVEPTLPAFDSATVAAVRVLRFTPGYVGREPVAVRVEFPVQWRFVEGEAPPPEEPPASAGLTGLAETAPSLRDPEGFASLLEQESPRLLRDAGVSGEVLVRLVVDQDGRATDVVVLRSTHPEFSSATRRVLRRVRFVAGTVEGIPVRASIDVPIAWMVQRMGPPPGASVDALRDPPRH